jgi:hypothetical protein
VSNRDVDRGEPRIDHRTEDWWASIDSEILTCLAGHDVMTPRELGSALGISEGEVVAFLAMLAPEGKVTICQVKLGKPANSEGASAPSRGLLLPESIARLSPALETEHQAVGDRSRASRPTRPTGCSPAVSKARQAR